LAEGMLVIMNQSSDLNRQLEAAREEGNQAFVRQTIQAANPSLTSEQLDAAMQVIGLISFMDAAQKNDALRQEALYLAQQKDTRGLEKLFADWINPPLDRAQIRTLMLYLE